MATGLSEYPRWNRHAGGAQGRHFDQLGDVIIAQVSVVLKLRIQKKRRPGKGCLGLEPSGGRLPVGTESQAQIFEPRRRARKFKALFPVVVAPAAASRKSRPDNFEGVSGIKIDTRLSQLAGSEAVEQDEGDRQSLPRISNGITHEGKELLELGFGANQDLLSRA